ncbi:hypothetical protein [Yunchengibacter salinarum]|uniref:hypothetical protein n=1 Tax=Yunchengibacter salinarum TaxID=3133399 RepID=UPI0035B624FE
MTDPVPAATASRIGFFIFLGLVIGAILSGLTTAVAGFEGALMGALAGALLAWALDRRARSKAGPDDES